MERLRDVENTLFVCWFDFLGLYLEFVMGNRKIGVVQAELAQAQGIIWIWLQFWSVTEAWLPKGKQWSYLPNGTLWKHSRQVNLLF